MLARARVSDSAADLAQRPVSNLRVLPVPEAIENCGLKKIGLRRSASDPDTWEILAGVHNYGTRPRTVTLALAFAGSPAGMRQMTVPPGAEQNASFEYRSRAAGWLEARLLPPDDFPGNDRAVLELPARRLLKVVVYSEEPELFRPVLGANPEVDAVFRKPAEYRAGGDAGIVILDRFSPPQAAVRGLHLDRAARGTLAGADAVGRKECSGGALALGPSACGRPARERSASWMRRKCSSPRREMSRWRRPTPGR